MKTPALEEIRFGPSGHLPALRLLVSIYCDPRHWLRAERAWSRWQRLRVVTAVWLHVVVYVAVVALLGRLLAVNLVQARTTEHIDRGEHFFWVFIILVLSFGLSVVISFVGRPVLGLLGSLLFGVVGGVLLGVGGYFHAGFVVGAIGGLVFGLLQLAGIDAVFLGSIAAGFFGVLGFGVLQGFFFGLGAIAGSAAGLFTGLLRWYYFPLHWVLVRSRNLRIARRLHPVFWDHAIGLQLRELDHWLVRYAEAEPVDGQRQIEEIITNYRSQRAAALWAKTTLLAREAGRVAHLTELDAILVQLPDGEKGYLAQTALVRERALGVSRQQRYVDSVTRPFFREQATQTLRAEIQAFSAQVGGYHEPLASEFRQAAEAWLGIAGRQLQEVAQQQRREPTPQIFRAGDPVRRDAEAFVPRVDIVGALENEIMAGPGCPGILLYGRRRLGKSTVIRNLDGFLPEAVMTVVVSMQNPEAFASESSWAALLGAEIRRRWATATVSGVVPVDLRTLFQFLDACQAQLEAENRRLLLCIDEFEEIDRRIGEGKFSEDWPAVLRESVQSHRRVTWLLAGSHHFSELPHVRWSSYFVSMRTVEVPPFSQEETRRLLSQPLQQSRREEARAAAGVFGAGFWGERGVDRIHAEAGGWPHLVQLIASTVVDLCNQRELGRADASLLEEACAKAVISGDSVLAELMLYRSQEYPAAWSYLVGFREAERQSPPSEDALRLVLKRHLLVKDSDGGQWTLRVPLMARWLRERT